MRWQIGFAVVLSLAVVACSSSPAPEPLPPVRDVKGIAFVDVAPAAGLVHPVICGAADKAYLIDTNGTGAAVLDADGDGRFDLYVVHGSTLERRDSGPTPNRLYRNRGDGRFDEIAASSGVDDRSYGSGVLAFDPDDDGDTDLLVTNFGPDRFYRNLGTGRFEEVAEEVGLADPGWSMGAAAADWDLDGDLDLYVARYLEFDPDDPPVDVSRGGDRQCRFKGAVVACGPLGLTAEFDRLYRNDSGRFVDVSAASGIHGVVPGYGMGVVWLDADEDGRLDVYVASDATPNHLFLNRGDSFVEDGEMSGTALGGDGVPQSGMGIALGDLDGDLAEEIVVTNYSDQPNAVYRPLGDGLYEDVTDYVGLGEASYRYLGWGVAAFDVELDGDLDLFVANGHVYPEVDQVDPSTSYRQRDQLFLNDGRGGFREWDGWPGTDLAVEAGSRGLVRVDYDDDGDIDLLVVRLEAPPALLRNDSRRQGEWIGIQLVGPPGNRQAVGARVTVRSGDRSWARDQRLGSSYMSSEDPRLHFGLGPGVEAVEVEVRWPAGDREVFSGLEVGRYHSVRRGGGQAAD